MNDGKKGQGKLQDDTVIKITDINSAGNTIYFTIITNKIPQNGLYPIDFKQNFSDLYKDICKKWRLNPEKTRVSWPNDSMLLKDQISLRLNEINL